MKFIEARTLLFYRRLLKTMMNVFKGDPQSFHRVRISARKEILKNKDVTQRMELNKKLFEGEEARNMLLCHIIQGNLTNQGHYRWAVRKEHAMGTATTVPQTFIEKNYKNYMSKKVIVTGSSGYVGNYLAREIARHNPLTSVIGFSRRGGTRSSTKQTQIPDNLSFVKGDCLQPQTMQPHLNEADALVHCVGVISGSSDKKNPKSLYAGNCLSLQRPAQILAKSAQQQKRKKKVVMISSHSAPPFMQTYLKTKRQAELYLESQTSHLQSRIIRPGLIWHMQQRPWIAAFMPFLSKNYYKLYSKLVKERGREELKSVLKSLLLLPLPSHLDSIAYQANQFIKYEDQDAEKQIFEVIDPFVMADHYWNKPYES